MRISFEGIGQVMATFLADDCQEGHVCTVEEHGAVKTAGAREDFWGVVQHVDQGKAAVILEGFVTVSYSGSHFDPGIRNLSSDGNGGVMLDEDGKAYMVVSVNYAGRTCVIKL